jgi:type II secretory pathway pseudopilin PulG
MVYKAKHSGSGSSGFTVIELMLGIGLFGIIAPSIIFMVVSINRINDRAADLTYANIIAENKIESLRSAGYNSIDLSTVDFTAELPATFTEPRSASYTVTQPATGLKLVTINIEYKDQSINRQLTYGNVISELGVAQ